MSYAGGYVREGADAGQGDVDEPVDRRLRRQPGGRGERVQAVGGQLPRRHVVPYLAAPGRLGDQVGQEIVEVRVRLGDVLAAMQQARQVRTVAPPPRQP